MHRSNRAIDKSLPFSSVASSIAICRSCVCSWIPWTPDRNPFCWHENHLRSEVVLVRRVAGTREKIL